MKKAIIAKKVGMTQVFAENGEIIPVTVLDAGPCYVVQIKNEEKDGYCALQIGYSPIKEGKATKPVVGHFKSSQVAPQRILKEFKLEGEFALGDEITAGVFAPGEKVNISGVSKGKGFQGVIKRHGQHRGPMKHGSKFHRAPGSMGGSSDPSRVFKGKNLPGHMGSQNCTVQNLTVVRADAENNMILVKGAVPGSNGSIVYVTDAKQGQKA